MASLPQASDLEKIRDLQIFAQTVAEGLHAGIHRSPLKGASNEFKQHRPYVPGDEIRKIDWKIFGRSDRFFIKEFENETERPAVLLVDTSGSMGYQSAGEETTKLDYATRLGAALSYLLNAQGDPVGLATFDTRVRKMIPARSKRSHLASICKQLADTTPGGEGDLSEVVREFATRYKRRSFVMMISDCFAPSKELVKALSQLRVRGHEVLIFQIWHPDELEFPFKRGTRFVNLEDPEDEEQVDPATLRKSYLGRLAEWRDELEAGLLQNRIELLPMRTDEPVGDALANFLAARRV